MCHGVLRELWNINTNGPVIIHDTSHPSMRCNAQTPRFSNAVLSTENTPEASRATSKGQLVRLVCAHTAPMSSQTSCNQLNQEGIGLKVGSPTVVIGNSPGRVCELGYFEHPEMWSKQFLSGISLKQHVSNKKLAWARTRSLKKFPTVIRLT